MKSYFFYIKKPPINFQNPRTTFEKSKKQPKKTFEKGQKGGGGPRIFFWLESYFFVTKNPSKFSEPYDNPFWEKSNNGRKKERRLMLKIVPSKFWGLESCVWVGTRPATVCVGTKPPPVGTGPRPSTVWAETRPTTVLVGTRPSFPAMWVVTRLQLGWEQDLLQWGWGQLRLLCRWDWDQDRALLPCGCSV